jgi:asparagine synthase (glutamine-hydrolysing)
MTRPDPKQVKAMTEIAGVPVGEIAQQFGTPTYVYDATKIVERINDLRQFDFIRYAQKACSNLAILDLVRRHGVLVDAVSAVFDFGSEPFIRLREHFWLTIFREAAQRQVEVGELARPRVGVDQVVGVRIGARQERGAVLDPERHPRIAGKSKYGVMNRAFRALKDLFAVKGYKTTWGSVPFKDQMIDEDAFVYTQFKKAGAVLVANGEIYNDLEIRRQLADAHYQSKSDCESPLHLYRRKGLDFVDDLRGMYAIAIYDRATSKLVLTRDPFGIKPLYYAEYPGGMIFASEVQALLKTGLVAPKVRIEAATELVQLQFITGRRTIFEDINRVAPGETLSLRGGRIVGRRQKPALPEGTALEIDEAEALKLLDGALMDSVAMHQRSDVPYGMFLSGGVDSSAILACMARLNDTPVRAFTAGFPGTAAADERESAKRVAKAAGADHVEIAVTESDFWRYLPAIAAAMDDPAADYAMLPTYLLAAEAAKELKVVLTGEGGDELFAGYGRYRSALRSPLLGGRPMRRRGFLDGMGVLRDSSRHWRAGISAGERRLAAGDMTRLQQAQALDCADWLPNDLLVKLDRCLMAHGLEGRTPLLDPVIADLAFKLPDGLKIASCFIGAIIISSLISRRA